MQCCPNCGTNLSKFLSALETEDFTYGNVTLTIGNEIIFEGRRLDIMPRARALVEVLIRAKGRTISRRDLLDIMDLSDETEMRTVDVCVKRARHAFRAIDPEFGQIATVYGLGYRFDKKEMAKLSLVA